MSNKKSTNTNNDKRTPGHSRQTSLKKTVNPTDDFHSDDEKQDENNTFYTLDKVLNNEDYNPKLSVLGTFLSKKEYSFNPNKLLETVSS